MTELTKITDVITAPKKIVGMLEFGSLFVNGGTYFPNFTYKDEIEAKNRREAYLKNPSEFPDTTEFEKSTDLTVNLFLDYHHIDYIEFLPNVHALFGASIDRCIAKKIDRHHLKKPMRADPNVILEAGSYLLLENGKYSDYEVKGPFVMLKSVSKGSLVIEFMDWFHKNNLDAEYEYTDYRHKHEPDHCDFVEWIVRSGYAQDMKNGTRWHIGESDDFCP